MYVAMLKHLPPVPSRPLPPLSKHGRLAPLGELEWEGKGKQEAGGVVNCAEHCMYVPQCMLTTATTNFMDVKVCTIGVLFWPLPRLSNFPLLNRYASSVIYVCSRPKSGQRRQLNSELATAPTLVRALIAVCAPSAAKSNRDRSTLSDRFVSHPPVDVHLRIELVVRFAAGAVTCPKTRRV